MATPTACIDYQQRNVSVPAEVAVHIAQRHKEIEDHLSKFCEVLQPLTWSILESGLTVTSFINWAF
jgi:hypothetical protein